MVKKKRSAKQLANDRRLGRMAKKRGKKKTTRRKNPIKEYVVFKYGQNGVSFLAVNSQWVGKGSKAKFISNSAPYTNRIAQHFADQYKRDKVGVAEKGVTSKQIIAKFAGKA